MSKAKEAPDAADAAVEAQEPVVEITLTEFCTRLSETVRRPELIGAFEHASKAAGRLKATSEAFQAAFTKFRNKPV